MFRQIKNILLGLIGLFLLNGFRCGEPDAFPDYTPFYFNLHSWQGKWLDNRGAEPILADQAVSREAFGLRLSAIMSRDGKDTLQTLPSGDTMLYLEKPIRRIQFFTLNGFDTLPPGTDISERFRLLFDARDSYNKHYFLVETLASFLNTQRVAWGTDYHADFIMTSPPAQAGFFECAVKITFDVTTILQRDTFFTLPAIFLQ